MFYQLVHNDASPRPDKYNTADGDSKEVRHLEMETHSLDPFSIIQKYYLLATITFL